MGLYIYYRVRSDRGYEEQGVKHYEGRRSLLRRDRATNLLRKEPGLSRAHVIKIVLEKKYRDKNEG